MKEGDKVYCKKSINDSIYPIQITKDKEYIILLIKKHYIKISSDEYYIGDPGYRFYGLNDSKATYKFDEYFLTEKQYRKLKLEKIYERR